MNFTIFMGGMDSNHQKLGRVVNMTLRHGRIIQSRMDVVIFDESNGDSWDRWGYEDWKAPATVVTSYHGIGHGSEHSTYIS